MKTTTAVHKMEEYVQDFREQLAKRDRASLAALIANTTRFFDTLIGELPVDSFMNDGVREFQNCISRFGKVCEKGDVQEAAMVLSDMERMLADMKKLCGTAQAMAV